MPRKSLAKAELAEPRQHAPPVPYRPDAPKPQRMANGQWAKGYSGATGLDAGRARRALNQDTIAAIHDAFRRGGRAAIEKVMKQQPAIFLKMLVLLVPREMSIEHTGGVKAMSDEAIEAAIATVTRMLEAKDVTPAQPPTREGEAEDVSAAPPDGSST